MRMFAITLADGRQLDGLDAGAPDGTPLVMHHGTPGSRLVPPWWDETCAATGFRLLAFSRAGYGGSTAQPGRSVADVADDTAAFADATGVDRFAVWGHSGGGPHSLACAALLPDRVTVAVSSAGVAPYDADGLDWTAGMGEANVEEFGLLHQGRESALAALEAERESVLGASPGEMAGALESLVSDIDLAACDRPFSEFLHASMSEGLRDDAVGWVDDDLAFVSPWGFDVGAITADVRIWQGVADLMVPPAHGRWLAAQLPNAPFELRPDHGHLSIVGPAGFAEILASLPHAT
jgi:pimeloyl-ACP methyl ester carboxylesterase